MKDPCLHCKTKGPNAEAHPPFALGRDVHFCHSILQHVNICPGRSHARAGLVVPTASCFRIHACRLCFLLHNPPLTLTEQPSPAGPSVAHNHLYTDFICTSQQQTFIHHGNGHTEGVTINIVNKVKGAEVNFKNIHFFLSGFNQDKHV